MSGNGDLRSGLDYTHPLHRASVVVEEVMFGDVKADNTSSVTTADEFVPFLVELFEQAGLEIDAEQVMDDALYYGANFKHMVGVEETLAYSIFLNGLMHGVALAAQLEPNDPRIKRGGAS